MEAESNKDLQWRGLNYILLDGKLLLGPSGFKPILITGLFIFIPFVLFLTFNSQFFHYNLNIVISVIAFLILIVTVYYMIVAATKDPGILPRSTRTLSSQQTKFKAKFNQMGYLTYYKRCETCFIVRPLRSHHCADCDNCVERFDHHCPWLSNCVAKRNYRDFYMFVLLLNILTIYMIAFSVVHIAIYLKVHINLFDAIGDFNNNSAAALNQVIVALFIVIYGLLSMIFTTGLLVYHTNLIVKNMTTNEELKSYFKKPIGNPYKRNTSTNCGQALFAKQSEPCLMDEIRNNNLLKEKRKNIYLEEELNRLNRLEEIKKEQLFTKTDHQEINVEVLDHNSLTNKKENLAIENNYEKVDNSLRNNNLYLDKASNQKNYTINNQNMGNVSNISGLNLNVNRRNFANDPEEEKIKNAINNFRSDDDSEKSNKSQRYREFNSNHLNNLEIGKSYETQTNLKYIKMNRNNQNIDDFTKSISKDETHNHVIKSEDIDLKISKDRK